jgi:uncharacterized BrkB/YihY/UPF0761 family membrane protein
MNDTQLLQRLDIIAPLSGSLLAVPAALLALVPLILELVRQHTKNDFILHDQRSTTRAVLVGLIIDIFLFTLPLLIWIITPYLRPEWSHWISVSALIAGILLLLVVFVLIFVIANIVLFKTRENAEDTD